MSTFFAILIITGILALLFFTIGRYSDEQVEEEENPLEEENPPLTKREKFLHDVMFEIEALKANAIPEEIERLNLSNFDPTHSERCIYGQMTGRCDTIRAHELMNESCIRLVDTKSSNLITQPQFLGPAHSNKLPIESDKFVVNGEYDKNKIWPGRVRSYAYLSALEGYILTENANIEGVMAFLKGETDSMEL